MKTVALVLLSILFVACKESPTDRHLICYNGGMVILDLRDVRVVNWGDGSILATDRNGRVTVASTAMCIALPPGVEK